MTSLTKFLLVFFLLYAFNFVYSQRTEFYRSCDDFNHPIAAHFSGPIKESQLDSILGRYFKLTYDYNRTTKVYNLKSVEHFFLNEEHPIYDYRNISDGRPNIEYVQAQKVEFTYDRNDNITKIEFKDKKGNPSENSSGVSMYRYQRVPSNSKFNYIEKSFYLDTNKTHVFRGSPYENDKKMSLQYANKNISGYRRRVLKKCHYYASGISKTISFEGSIK